MNQVGTITAHSRGWPLFERKAFSVEVLGSIDASDIESAESLRQQLDAVLSRYGVEVKVVPVQVLEMSAEDRAAKEALDQLSILTS